MDAVWEKLIIELSSSLASTFLPLSLSFLSFIFYFLFFIFFYSAVMLFTNVRGWLFSKSEEHGDIKAANLIDVCLLVVNWNNA